METKYCERTVALLHEAWREFGEKAAIGTSFQGAGLVIMDLARREGLGFPIFTIDTGLLFPETLELCRRLEVYLGRKIEVLRPDLTVEQQAEQFGEALWARDPDFCCTLRKVVPLQAKLRELECWITGLRRDQSETRSRTEEREYYELEPGRVVVKLNPMAMWPREAVWDYLRRHGVPYNPLHDQGYRSIGCMPCTRKVGEGESERAGRWTGFNKTECGIHTFMRRVEADR
ncbi:MAG: phosphoadenylyl-sulfate reductase [Methylacidiphilales bacterium]|nr:phosphoadenylyl-sulfate reductase [Candidatus Methylacidiphilales bacterium]MDW8349783.1 phosphoadenylyl-sulfate reductase [Verrucomicrobiae bacterium]